MILAINTSTLQYGLAILEEEGTVLADYLMARGERHFGSLMPSLDFLLGHLKSDVRDLNAVIVAKGPGSFTGLRVGLSAAKGLSHGLHVPIIGISSLEALASQMPHTPIPITPLLDSRKGEAFTARFAWHKGEDLVRREEDICLKFDDLPSFLRESTLFIGNDFHAQSLVLRRLFGDEVLLAPPHYWNLKASAIGALGLRRYLAHDFDAPQDLSPLYLRPPDIRPSPSTSSIQKLD